jgi:O-antigen/teichoic acid export membrane protein
MTKFWKTETRTGSVITPQDVAVTCAMNGTLPSPKRKKDSVAFSSAHAVVTNVAQVLGVLLATAMIARILGPAGKGTYDLYVTGITLLTAALTLGLNSGLIFTIASKRVNQFRLTADVLAFVAVCGSVAFVIVSCVLKMRMGQRLLPVALGPRTPLLMGLGVVALAASTMMRAILTGQRRFLLANYGDIVKQVLGLLFLLVIILGTHHLHWVPLPLIVLSNIVTILLTAVIYLRFTDLHRSAERAISSGFSACFRFGIPCYAATIIQMLNYRLDVFVVNAWHGAAPVGIYQVGVVIAQAINMIPSTVQGILFPTISAAHAGGESKSSQIAQANRFLTWSSAAIGVVLFFSSPFIVSRLFGVAYAGSVTALQILIPGCVFFVTANVIAGFFSGIGKPKLNLAASFVGIAFTVIFDLLFIPKWGYIGAAWASTISYGSSGLMTAILFTRETNMPLRSLYVPAVADLHVLKNLFREMKDVLRSKVER